MLFVVVVVTVNIYPFPYLLLLFLIYLINSWHFISLAHLYAVDAEITFQFKQKMAQ